jgi:hypothetical protein
MIHCPYCDTPNRKGSKYCSNCGRRLDTVRAGPCPTCKGLNPPNSLYCAFCGAPLMPSTEGDSVDTPTDSVQPSEVRQPVKPDSVPPARAELPEWLYQQPADTPATAPSTASDASGADRQGCKYLRDIPGALPAGDGWLALAVSSYLAERPRA